MADTGGMLPAPAKSNARWLVAGVAGIILLAFAAHGVSLANGFVWDDDNHVTSNLLLRDAAGLKRIWLEPQATPQYYPLTHTSFWLEYHVWGATPAGYHAVNVILHALGALLFWLVLRTLRVPGAWLAAALFAVHPVHVESVGWITERKNVLSGVFYLGALLLLWRSLFADGQPGARGWRPALYTAALLCFVAALLSKTVTCSLPAVALLLWWWRRGERWRQDWPRLLWLLPFVALGGALAWQTVWLERGHVGAAGPEWSLSFADRFLVAGRALWFYLAKLVWPQPLIFFYERWTVDSQVWWQWLYPAAFAALVAGLWLARRRLGRGPLVAVLIFAGTLVPALGFLNVYPHRYAFVADHFQYLASLAVIALVAAAVAPVFTGQPLGSPSLSWRLPAASGLGVLVLLAANHHAAFLSEDTLWRDTLAKNPDCWAAHYNLGLRLEQQGRQTDAADHFLQAIVLKPDHGKAMAQFAAILETQGKTADAEAFMRRAVEVQPDDWSIRLLAGDFFARRQQLAEAMAQYREALLRRPELYAARLGAGHVQMQLKNFTQAEVLYTKAAEAEPANPEPVLCLARALAGQGQRRAALAAAGRALALAQGDAGMTAAIHAFAAELNRADSGETAP